MYAYLLAVVLLISNVTLANNTCDIENIKDFYESALHRPVLSLNVLIEQLTGAD